MSSDFVFFWKKDAKNGLFSNWSEHSIKEDNIDNIIFNTAEHYLMYHKAKLFKDDINATKILACKDPLTVKHIGRQVKNFDDKIWNDHKEHIMYKALLLKTEQHPDVKKALIETGDAIIAEASPYDTIWGIGLEQYNNHAKDINKWKGQNLLGKAWMNVRLYFKNIEIENK